jgi:hypothetical protein
MQPHLCDTCRQHQAVHSFLDLDRATGVPTPRHLCITCYGLYPLPIDQQIDLEKQILTAGKCEVCGAPAFAISGIPGPERRVHCYECGRSSLGSESEVS